MSEELLTEADKEFKKRHAEKTKIKKMQKIKRYELSLIKNWYRKEKQRLDSIFWIDYNDWLNRQKKILSNGRKIRRKELAIRNFGF